MMAATASNDDQLESFLGRMQLRMKLASCLNLFAAQCRRYHMVAAAAVSCEISLQLESHLERGICSAQMRRHACQATRPFLLRQRNSLS